VQLSLSSRQIGCARQCQLHLVLTSTSAARVTVTAATETSAIQLPLGAPGCSAVGRGQLANYAVLLDPDDASDDRLTLQLRMCSGSAELWAATRLPPTIGQPVHDYASTGARLEPIEMPADVLSGRSKVFAAIHGLSVPSGTGTGTAASSGQPQEAEAMFCLEARPSGTVPSEQTLYGPASAITISPWPDADRMLTVGLAPLAALAGGVSSDQISYELWAGVDGSGVVFQTWCGIQQSGAQLLHATSTLSGDILRASFRLAMPGQRECQEGQCSGIAFDTSYVVTVVAVAHAPGQAASQPRQFIYQSVQWTPQSSAPSATASGGASGGLVFVILVLLMCCAGAAAIRLRERFPPTVRVKLDRLAALVERAREWSSHHRTWLRATIARGRPQPPARGAPRSGGERAEAMNAPLTLNSFLPQQVADLEPLSLPAQPLTAPPAAVATPLAAAPASGAAGAQAAAAPSQEVACDTVPLAAIATPTPMGTSSTRDNSDPAYNARLARARSAKGSSASKAKPTPTSIELPPFGTDAPGPAAAPATSAAHNDMED